MGEYYEEFVYFDLPSYYRDSRKRHHAYDEHGNHLDSCLLHDVASKISEIHLIDKIDASQVHFSVSKGVVALKGTLASEDALKFVVNALDSLEGVKKVQHELKIAP